MSYINLIKRKIKWKKKIKNVFFSNKIKLKKNILKI